MTTRLNPYLGFRDNARAAMEFYQSVFGGELSISTFAEFHASEEVDEQDLVMHAQLETPSGFTLMASDTPKSMTYDPGSAITVSVSGPKEDDAELRGYWDRLSDGGTITMPLDTAPWGDVFGMLTDRFGTNWMMSIGTEDSAA
ncbi:MAG TPA: VOC family protein [Terrimesophilobacter sp.]|nr:VOC family protein [Terrimesophilobacter sp.]